VNKIVREALPLGGSPAGGLSMVTGGMPVAGADGVEGVLGDLGANGEEVGYLRE